jgi:hypothetical protein
VARAGTLDNMDWAEPVGNIWSDSKAAWVKIEPELVNFLGQAWTGPVIGRLDPPQSGLKNPKIPRLRSPGA